MNGAAGGCGSCGPRKRGGLAAAALAILAVAAGTGAARADGWAYYGGDPGAARFSTLTQINRDNVGRLRPAWQWRHGDLERHPDRRGFAGFQATPILLPAEAGGHLVVCTPFNRNRRAALGL